MGFWDCVCSIGSSICSCVGSFISSVCSTVGSCIGAIASGISKLGSILGPLAGPIGQIASIICNIVGHITGALKEQETTEEMGERALQAEEQGIVPENYDSYNKYIDAIRDIVLDEQKSNARNPIDKQLAGGIVVDNCIREINPNLETCSLWIPAALGKISEDKMKAWVDIAKKNNIPLASVAKFLAGDADNYIDPDVKQFQNANSDQGRDVIFTAEKASNPNLERSDIYARIDSIREEVEKGMAEFDKANNA